MSGLSTPPARTQELLALGSSTLRGLDAHSRIRSAASVGLTAIGLSYGQLRASTSAGYGVTEIRRQADDLGVRVWEVELVGRALEATARAATLEFANRLFDLAAELGASHAVVVSERADDSAPGLLAELCDLGADRGVTVGLEFAPWTDVPDLRAAVDVARASGRANAGVVFDTWHFIRSGGRWEHVTPDLATAISCVQLSDGSRSPHPSFDPYEETRRRRLVPGAGEFDLVTGVRVLRATGYAGPWSIEVLSDDLERQAVADAIRRLVRGTERVLADEHPVGQVAQG